VKILRDKEGLLLILIEDDFFVIRQHGDLIFNVGPDANRDGLRFSKLTIAGVREVARPLIFETAFRRFNRELKVGGPPQYCPAAPVDPSQPTAPVGLPGGQNGHG
jgi:hypothetical protein